MFAVRPYTYNSLPSHFVWIGLPSEHLQWFRSTDEINEARDTESLVLCDKTETQESFNCTQKQLRKAVQDHLFLKHFVPGWTTGENEACTLEQCSVAIHSMLNYKKFVNNV